MSLNIKKINENTWQLDEEGVRFFLLTGSERALLIDSGMQTRDALEQAQALTDLPVELLNTHADIDHVGSNTEFAAFYMSPADEPQYRGQHPDHDCEIRPLTPGMTLDLGGRALEILAIPGHTPGSIGVLDPAARILFSGDPVQQNGKIFMFGPNRCLPQYIESLKELEMSRSRFDAIYPSHADCPLTGDVIRPLIEGAERILAGEQEGPVFPMFGTQVRCVQAGPAAFLLPASQE